MNTDPNLIARFFKGNFLITPALIQQKLFSTRAFVFDWDGVFNNGYKDENGSSAFSEIDSMGTNMLRFNHYLRNGKPPVVAIISGERNKASFSFAAREHLDAVYYKVADKSEALKHFCSRYSLQASEITWVFDDVPDFALAKQCGLRIMVARDCNPVLLEFAGSEQLADYVTAAQSGQFAIREMTELMMALSGKYAETITNRFGFTPVYREYLVERNKPGTSFYTLKDSIITEQAPA